jgi:hypothetical protein
MYDAVVAQRVRQLLHDQDDADRRQHPLDDRRREVVADDARPQRTQPQLQEARQHHGRQEGREGTELVDRHDHDRREPGRRARHHQAATR